MKITDCNSFLLPTPLSEIQTSFQLCFESYLLRKENITIFIISYHIGSNIIHLSCNELFRYLFVTGTSRFVLCFSFSFYNASFIYNICNGIQSCLSKTSSTLSQDYLSMLQNVMSWFLIIHQFDSF